VSRAGEGVAHRRRRSDVTGRFYCVECGEYWPCAAVADRKPLVLFDVDNTVGCGLGGLNGPCCEPRPGMSLLMAALFMLGYEIRLWSAGGAEHAEKTAEQCELTDFITGYHDKPDYPIQADAVVAMFGCLPVLSIDNDPTERVEGVPFVEVSDYWGRHADEIEGIVMRRG